MMDITKRYTNGEVTIVWQPAKCIHSMNCFKGLPQVFDPNKRPWANAEGASTEQIVNQIKKCPSGALSFEMNDVLTFMPSSSCGF
ncbi:MAG TPA: (4Fe-4S)-binding protein [Cyclobacteriaceae bacterium]